MKELFISLLIGMLFSLTIITCTEREDQLVKKHCSGLSGYAYGACQASIY